MFKTTPLPSEPITTGPQCKTFEQMVGRPELRFSAKCPVTAVHCRVIDLEQHDVGVGAGRDAAIDAAETQFIFLLDDGHIVTERRRLQFIDARFQEHSLNILAVR